MERTLAKVWCETLELDTVGVHDNFFDLGGNSVLSLRLVTAMSSALARPIPIVSLFRHPTIAQLCEALNSTGTDQEPVKAHKAKTDRAKQHRAAIARQRERLRQRQEGSP